MFRMSKMFGLALIGFMLVVCTISSAQQGKEEEKKEKGKFGPGGRGGMGMRSQPGKIFSTFIIAQLKLTDDQTKQLEAMQKDVDEKVAKLLTDDQKTKLKELATARPGFGGGGRPRPKAPAPAPEEKKKDN